MNAVIVNKAGRAKRKIFIRYFRFLKESLFSYKYKEEISHTKIEIKIRGIKRYSFEMIPFKEIFRM